MAKSAVNRISGTVTTGQRVLREQRTLASSREEVRVMRAMFWLAFLVAMVTAFVAATIVSVVFWLFGVWPGVGVGLGAVVVCAFLLVRRLRQQ